VYVIRRTVKQACNKFCPDAEMQYTLEDELADAYAEWDNAMYMLNNAQNEWRANYAVLQLQAIDAWIRAIKYEKGESIAKTVVGAAQKK